jgi:hypothetical protein
MLWHEIRAAYPKQWLIIEAIEAHTTQNSRRHIDQLAVVEKCADGSSAMKRYRELHTKYPQSEFYFVHTDRQELDVHERQWVGVRRSNAVSLEG